MTYYSLAFEGSHLSSPWSIGWDSALTEVSICVDPLTHVQVDTVLHAYAVGSSTKTMLGSERPPS